MTGITWLEVALGLLLVGIVVCILIDRLGFHAGAGGGD